MRLPAKDKATFDQIVPGVFPVEWRAQAILTRSEADQEEPTSPLSVAKRIRRLNVKAALEVGLVAPGKIPLLAGLRRQLL